MSREKRDDIMAKDQLPSVSGAKLDDEILMGKDFYNDLDRFLSKPPPSARSGRDLPTLEKLKRERKKIKASMRKSRETSTMNLRGRVSSKIDTGTRSSHKEDAKPFDYALVRFFDFAFSLNSHTHTHTHTTQTNSLPKQWITCQVQNQQEQL